MASFHLATDLLTAIYDGIKSKIFLAVYPVGSIYLSDNATNPNTKFGGTWVKLSGGFIYGSTSTSGNTYSTGNGTGTSTNNHTLTINEIPSHSHKFTLAYGGNDPVKGFNYGNSLAGVFGREDGNDFIGSTGGGKGHSHNIPYIACSIWRRTA